ncbi:pleckstrin homology domain-containing family M member 1 [Brachyhypopomus gauderio]|uniref:pleckstrin homology domain-containing family M member 1 n=1 Tax=Brachyhypopomus gauderio TaxID=698409 RepID=UPI004041830F
MLHNASHDAPCLRWDGTPSVCYLTGAGLIEEPGHCWIPLTNLLDNVHLYFLLILKKRTTLKCVSTGSEGNSRETMLATQTTDCVPEAKNVKQWIKEKLAQTLKTLQKRYVATDTPVTSEDSDANQLCCALEAVFIHGLRSKHIRADAGGRGRKGPPLPQPAFWSLLKNVTHRDVILELEGLSFISSDVGRCRAWVRLALNDGLLECYLVSLLREASQLDGHYQPGALLLDPEEREVLLSLLQGLASLAFQLSYKSAVLNEWTVTPLALAGLCPAAPDEAARPPAGHRGSWDTASQSSGGSDGLVEVLGRVGNGPCGCGSPLTASDLSLDTAGSSLLSSSLSSDGQTPERDVWSGHEGELGHTEHGTSTIAGGSSSSSQDLAKEDVDVMSPSPESMVTHSSSEEDSSDGQDEPQHSPDASEQNSCGALPASSEVETWRGANPEPDAAAVLLHPVLPETSLTVLPGENWRSNNAPGTVSLCSPALTSKTTSDTLTNHAPSPLTCCLEEDSGHVPVQRTCSVLSKKISSGSLYSSQTSPSWISEEDFYKPDPYGSGDSEGPDNSDVAQMNGTVSPGPEPLSPPSVVHRRQIGLSNPFRGLLKLGQLERRGAMGLWRGYYCELSPYELRLYADADERECCENCSLLRCEDVRLSSSGEGRFGLTFSGKRLHLRAPSSGEAEDWVDRILEAVNKARPVGRDESSRTPALGGESDTPSPTSAPASPERIPTTETCQPPWTDWIRPAEPEPDAIKEAVVCVSQEERGWTWMVLSLSLEALRGFAMRQGHKTATFSHPIETVRDVVPDAALGGPAFFKVLMAHETLTLQAESAEEARAWRSLIRGALSSYLEAEEDGAGEQVVYPSRGQGGNVQRLVQHRLQGDGALLSHLTTVPVERGLDVQNFKCAGCPRQIGVSLGRAKLCKFSGQYYCETCHYGDASIIPSRMVHNWDLTAHEVSRQALKLLADVEHEPLLNLDILNPDLFDHSETMTTVHCLRQKLRLLGDYLLICRSGIRKVMEPRLEQRTYLLESSSLYSVMDLRQIADGHYESFLQSLIQFSSNHVTNCDLCTQRGFICQICNMDDIIFPFQFDSTSRCQVCKTVFHSTCKAQSLACPRCERLQRYRDRHLLQ